MSRKKKLLIAAMAAGAAGVALFGAYLVRNFVSHGSPFEPYGADEARADGSAS